MSQTSLHSYHSVSSSDESEGSVVLVNSSPVKESPENDPSNFLVFDRNPPKRPREKVANGGDAKLKKLEKAAEKKLMEHISPATCLKYITAYVSRNILSNPMFPGFLDKLLLDVEIKISDLEDDSIFWKRSLVSGEIVEEPHRLVILDHVKLLRLIEDCSINRYFLDMRESNPNVILYLVIYGLKDFCKRIRKKSKLSLEEKELKMKPSKDMVESVLCELQLISNIQSRLIDDLDELVLFVRQTTKSVGEEPYRKKKAELEVDKRLYLQEDSRSCVKTDKNNFGMKRLWEQQLAQLPKSSLPCAKAITAVYPSPLALYKAYQGIARQAEKEDLLQDIFIGRQGKRIGPELSKKICFLFSSNGEVCSNDSENINF